MCVSLNKVEGVGVGSKDRNYFSFSSSCFSAFTLAEVLITLGIIGIVAELTIPAVVSSSEKQVTVSKVKEVYSILSQATTSLNNDCGGDISACITSPTANVVVDPTATAEVANLYKGKLSISKECPNNTIKGCFADKDLKNLGNPDPGLNLATYSDINNGRFLLKNGMAIAFLWEGCFPSPVLYYVILVDINGTKEPNQWGKDVFEFYYDFNKKSLYPDTYNELWCSTSSYGYGCSVKILRDSAINYY